MFLTILRVGCAECGNARQVAATQAQPNDISPKRPEYKPYDLGSTNHDELEARKPQSVANRAARQKLFLFGHSGPLPTSPRCPDPLSILVACGTVRARQGPYDTPRRHAKTLAHL